MNDELTAVDIKKMEEEIRYRQLELRPKILEDVKTAREFGDLSENFEYKAAKQEKRRNDSRIRYLERMIKTAKVIDASSNPDEIGLFDKVTIYIEEDDEEQTIELVTTLRQNAHDLAQLDQRRLIVDLRRPQLRLLSLAAVDLPVYDAGDRCVFLHTISVLDCQKHRL